MLADYFPFIRLKACCTVYLCVSFQSPSLLSACTSYIPSIIKNSLYWFYWPLIHLTNLLWWSGALSSDSGLSLCSCACNSGFQRSVWRSSHTNTEEEREWEKLNLWASYLQPLGINMRSHTGKRVPQALEYIWRHIHNSPCICLILSWCFIQSNPGHTNPHVNYMFYFVTFLSFLLMPMVSQRIICCFAEGAWQLCCLIHLN